MKKFTLFAASMLLAGTTFAADGYWYIRGAFNDYNPNEDQTWALMDDDEGEANVFTGTFTVPAGEFSFNLMNSEDQIFVPMDKDMYLTPMAVTFTDNVFKGSSSLAWDDDEEYFYWFNKDWPGGMITVSVDANGNNPSIEIYAFPKQEAGSDDLYTIVGPEDGYIAIIWENYMVWPSGSGAYLETSDGEKINLARKGQAEVYQIYLNDDEDEIPGMITVNLNSLDLVAGEYTLVIPEGYVDVVSEDYEYWESNPEISFTFEYVESVPTLDYWYIRGAFNNYSPNGLDEWALMDDDEGENGVYTGTFTVPAGEFSFNLLSPSGAIFIPATISSEEVVFENNIYTGSADLAYDETEAAYYWTNADWAGGMITVSIDANTGELEIYAFPESNDFNNDYTLTPLNEEGVITIVWNGAIDDVWYESGNAYLVNADGEEIALAKSIPGQPGQVTLLDSDPYGLSIDITSLDLEAGDYTLVIPAKYIQVVSDDWETWLYNPEISYKFTVESTGIQSIGVENGMTIYNLQGVKVDAKSLNNGLYIINGKKVLIRK